MPQPLAVAHTSNSTCSDFRRMWINSDGIPESNVRMTRQDDCNDTCVK